MRLDLTDVATICRRLQAQLAEQADIEIAALKKLDNQTDQQFAEVKERARTEAFKVTTSLIGRDGQTLFGADDAVFSAPNRPDKIASIFMTNITAYQSFAHQRPLHSFELTLDFSKPRLIDFTVPVSAPTANSSQLFVDGSRDAWVAAITNAVTQTTEARKTNRRWLHRGQLYDAGLLLFGVPFTLYVCWRLSGWIEHHLGSINPFLSAAAYVYLFFFLLNGYRALFGYTKWTFPLVELADNNDTSISHRAVWGAIVLALLVNVVWEVLKLFW
ncbi:MAG: hypothetical protein WDM91_17505 [Rhizomicrobium sp.]